VIGNDVVDLRCDETLAGARNPRFDDRVYTVQERRTLAECASPDLWRWCLWSAKESAYKVARRMDARQIWSPRRFEVTLDEDLRGRVRWPEGECRVRIEHADERVHAVAARDEADLDSTRTEVARLGAASPDAETPSAAVRSLAIRHLAPLLGAEPAALEVRRRERIPALFARERELAWPLSLSHHGRFVAFAALPAEPRS
jgi:phosphopantetheinyl transferase (holo-ACP synthase)